MVGPIGLGPVIVAGEAACCADRPGSGWITSGGACPPPSFAHSPLLPNHVGRKRYARNSVLHDPGQGVRLWPLSHACRVETRPQGSPMVERRLNGEHHDNAYGAQHYHPRSSYDAPDLINRKPRQTRAEPPPDAEGPRLDPRFPGSFKTSVSILSSLRSVPWSAKGARSSIITDTTPVSQSRQIGAESVLGCVLTEVSTPTELWCHSRARRIGAHVRVTPPTPSTPPTPHAAPYRWHCFEPTARA
jgi:hypothetical protein